MEKHVAFTIQIDEQAIAPQSAEVFLYRLLNNLNNEHPILSVTVDGVTVDTSKPGALYDLPLGEDKPLESL